MINTGFPLQVGFIAWSPDFKLTAAAQPPAPVTMRDKRGYERAFKVWLTSDGKVAK
jgi:hypothetical protein